MNAALGYSLIVGGLFLLASVILAFIFEKWGLAE